MARKGKPSLTQASPRNAHFEFRAQVVLQPKEASGESDPGVNGSLVS
jgi:hypothetical protein